MLAEVIDMYKKVISIILFINIFVFIPSSITSSAVVYRDVAD